MDYLLLLLCPFVLLLLLVAGIVWLVRRTRAPIPSHPQVAEPALPRDLAQFAAFDRLVVRWAAEGRLDAALAGQVRDLIAAEWQTLRPAAPQPPARADAQAPEPSVDPGLPAPASAAPPVPPAPVLTAPASRQAAEPGAAPPQGRAARPALGAALLALGTRRALLFLGTFLLVLSSLTLVVFSWASLPPVVQFAILAGTTGAIWAGGAWMARRPELATAGRNLQAVAALLLPVVGFALGRPGMLDLAPRPGWQLASAASLGAYLMAAARTRRPFYSGAAAVAAASLLLAALGALAPAWQLVPAVLLMAALLPLAGALRATREPRVAAGPRWVALIGGPLFGLAGGLLYLAEGAGYPFAATLLASAVFCGLAYRLEARVAWLWAALPLPPVALHLALVAAGAAVPVQALALALTALAYLALAVAAEGRLAPAARPLFAGAIGLGLLALIPASTGAEAARLALPPLVVLGAALVALVERGRLAWLGAQRAVAANGGLAGAAALGFIWLGALAELWVDRGATAGLILLPLAAIYFAAARWWPGRLRPGYDLALQAVAVLVAAVAGAATLFDGETRLPGAILVAAIFAAQAALRRRWPWAAVSLGAAALAAGFAVERFVAPEGQLRALTIVVLALAALYSLGGERLRSTGIRYWAWPGVACGALGGLLAAALALLQVYAAPALLVGTYLALAALLGAHTALWRRAAVGYPAALLVVVATMVAAGEGFFLGWRPAPGDTAYVVCGLAVGLALLGQALRPFGRAYALPYELAAFVVLPAAPLLAGGDPAHLSLTWAAMAGLYAAALWRYRLPWMLALAFIAGDMALLQGAAWLLPARDPAGAGLLLGAAVAAQALGSGWLRRGRNSADHGDAASAWKPSAAPLRVRAGVWGYLSASVGGLGALALALGSPAYAAGVAGLLAAVLAVLVVVEAREAPAWASLGLALAAAWFLHRHLGLAPAWAGAWIVLELAGVSLAGWGLAAWRAARPWRRPTTVGAAGAATLLTALVGALALMAGLPPLTFALASLGLLLATVAVRERELWYAYGSGAAFVGAALCQLADWGFSEPQWYVVPAGLYLLALAWGLRRFQGRRRASQLVETAAVLMLLGVTFGQAISGARGPYSASYAWLLFGEALLVAAYGALARLRVPFVGGVAFFVAGATWLAVDAAQLVNQWVLLGCVGLLMVLAYVVLERHQERLTRAGRYWVAQLQSWG